MKPRHNLVNDSLEQALPYEPNPIKRLGVYTRFTSEGNANIDVEAMLIDLIVVAKIADALGAGPGGADGLCNQIHTMWPDIEAKPYISGNLKQ
jgi:hypothetical protein